MSNTQITPSRGARTIVTLLVLIVVLGVTGAVVASVVGRSPAVASSVVIPSVLLLYRFLLRRRAVPPRDASRAEHVLLEASNTRGRVVQAVLPLVGVVLGMGGVTMLVRVGGGLSIASVAMTVAAVALIVVPLRTIIAWDVTHKGHAIRFEADPCFGERLLIDGQVVDKGGVGLDMVLLGTIASGEGAGDVIRATSFAGIPTFSCRIVAESPAVAGQRV
jgi:hypothetical protein